MGHDRGQSDNRARLWASRAQRLEGDVGAQTSPKRQREEGGRCPVIEAETWGPRAAHGPADVRDKQARGGHPETAPCLLLPQTCGPQ